MSERINKLQPDRTLYLRGFDTFAAAASIHNASPTGFQISGIFRDPADFAVAVLYDVDNAFEHLSIRYLPDFDFAGLTLNFSLLYSDTVQPIDSPKYNWIDWATLDYVLEDGSSGRVPLLDNSMLAGTAFPAAAATLAVVVNAIQLDERLTLWYQNLAFDYTVPGGIRGTATYFAQAAGTSASISVNSTTYTYHVPSTGPQDGTTIAANLAAIADSDPQVHFYSTPGSNIITFIPKVNTQAVVNVSGYTMWLMADPVDAFIAGTLASQINHFNWAGANTTHGLLAAINPASPNQITVTAAQYGTVNTNNNSVSWVSGTKFSGVAPGTTFMIAGTPYQVASVESPLQLTLAAPAPILTGVPYLAPRGGRDGNMITLYSLSNSSNVTFDQPQVQLSGGSSLVTWNCSLDFTALSIDKLRQCWLTFAPSLANGAAYTASEWLATFSNWSLTGPASVAALQIAGPGSVRIEENYAACTFNQPWLAQAGPYSGYFAAKSQTLNDWVSITYTCQFTHNLYLGTSLDGSTASATGLTLVTDSLYNNSFNGVPYSIYSDRGVAGVRIDTNPEMMLDCRFNTVGSELVTRRLLQPAAIAPGKHTVTIRIAEAGWIYFDFLEAAVLSDIPDPLTPRTNISPALDFDTDQTYKVSPSRLLWMLQKLGYAGPINEYLGVFWWNQRTPKAGTGSVSTAQVTFPSGFIDGDLIYLEFDPAGATTLQKTVFPDDTPDTIAGHFADFINSSLTGSWASTVPGGILTITGRSPALPYNLTLTATVKPPHITVPVTYIGPPVGVSPDWDIDDTVSPPINRAVADWHADFYSQCHTLGLQVVTSCSMELVNPPDGYAAHYPDALSTPVTTATDFGGLFSTQCAVGSSKMLAYQKAVYRQIASMQSAAGLTPWVQYGEFLWWYFAGPSGMGYYDAETVAAAAASTGLGRALHTFLTPNDDPNAVNGGADAVFLRNRLRDYVAALVADIRSQYPVVTCEVLWPYDVNYPTPLSTGGGQLNRFVNLPVEWQTKPSSGLDRMKVEALAFATSLRNLNLAREAVGLFSAFGWPLDSLTYLVPVFGSATPWIRELSLARAAGIAVTNLWALDHVCLYNLSVPERPLERRSVAKK
jgi:hypothetical protein